MCTYIRGRQRSQLVTTSYNKVHYVRVSKSFVSDIDIEVKTDQNQNVAFKYGKVVAKLHFRTVKQWLRF